VPTTSSGESNDQIPVYLPRALCQRAQRFVGERFASVDAFVAHAVREMLAREEMKESTGLSEEEEQRVKARLRALGYLE
jgi:Arc/MetJ-type ribon-helix-helix transcriptional regulator